MSTLQMEAMQYSIQCIPEMSEEQLLKLIDFIRSTVAPLVSHSVIIRPATNKGGIKIGLHDGEKYLANGHDFDEFNDEILPCG